MAQQVSWQRAWVISLVFHLMAIGILGWFGADLLTKGESPQVMEVDLFAGESGHGGGYGGGGYGGGYGGGPAGGTGAAGVPAGQPVGAAAAPGLTASSDSMIADGTAAMTTGETITSTGTTGSSAAGFPGGSDTGSGTGGNGGGGSGYGPGGPGYGGGSGYGSNGNSYAPQQLQPPRILKKVDPRYPEQARQQGSEGTVQLRIEILENGRPGDIEIAASSGDDRLDAAAVDAVEHWRFVPARDINTGAAVRCFTTLPVAFRLE